ncbi:hypothetical protein [Halomonas halocynthiae]|uniref:hypothetical protein n=1 Tax=Halomonas halocynthiae TaxID=176290 RepID=UPI00040CA22B|nr:hypothetical protein [Halomonas halocynthiae]
MSLFKITFARTGQETVIEATDWRDAVRQTGRRDACCIINDATGSPPVEVWFDADSPQGIGAQTVEGALAGAVAYLDSQEVAQ